MENNSGKDNIKHDRLVDENETESDLIEQSKLMFENPLIVPPGLYRAVIDFEAHFDVSEKYPIMILGETGVGKTLFLYLAKQFFKKQQCNEERVPVIAEANCAHFDKNLARSELFGHVKGAFTGAEKDKIGIVEAANGGMLILEEMGDLPSEVQAMLLTFVETGSYQRVGDVAVRNANVKLVGATNRASELRDEFKHRFFPYYVPPIRNRKGDILYYLRELFPEITSGLSRYDVMLLLAHNWPGNVREIERIGRLLKRELYVKKQLMRNNSSGVEDSSAKISHLDPKDTSFNPEILENFVRDLQAANVDVVFLQRLMKKQRLSLYDERDDLAFKELTDKKNCCCTWFDQYCLKYCNEFDPFEDVYKGYLLFCDLFCQDPNKDANIIETIKESGQPKYYEILREYPEINDKQLNKLGMGIVLFLKDIDDNRFFSAEDPYNLWEEIEQRVDKNNSKIEQFENIESMKEEDLLRYYYSKKLQKTGGNIKAAAQSIGLNESTFRNRMKNLNMTFEKDQYRY